MLITFEIGSDLKQIIDRLDVLRPPKGNHQDLLVCMQTRGKQAAPKVEPGWEGMDQYRQCSEQQQSP